MTDNRPDKTDALAMAMEQTLLAIQFVDGGISDAEVMSAAMYILVDAGMGAVEAGVITREKLANDICEAARRVVSEWSDGETKH